MPKDLTPSNTTKKPIRNTAVAVKDTANKRDLPVVTASGRGKLAERILDLAFENGVKVRTDAPLAEILAEMDMDSPIPTEAFMAVAEVLSYVYRANGQPNPFDTVLDHDKDET